MQNVMSIDKYLSMGTMLQACNSVDEGGFASSIWSNEGNDLILEHCEIEVFNHMVSMVAMTIARCNILDYNALILLILLRWSEHSALLNQGKFLWQKPNSFGRLELADQLLLINSKVIY